MKMRFSFIVFVMIAALCFGTSALWAKPKDSSSLKREIEQERSRLEQLNKEIHEAQEKAKKVERKQGSVLKTIEKLDQKLVRKRNEYKRINRLLKKKDRDLAQLNDKLVQLRSGTKERRESISARLRLLYMEGRDGYLKALLAADTFANFERRLAYLSTITKQEYQLLQQFHSDLKEVERLSEQQAQARAELLNYKRETEKAINEMKGVKNTKRVILTSLSKEKDAYERSLEDLRLSAERVDALVKELDQRFKLSQSRSRGRPSRPLSHGSLLWPAEGKVVTWFGRQKHPTFDTYVNKKGIEIETGGGSPIRTVSDGQVVYADWLKGYGLVMIVDHHNGFFSLYAHASKLLVKEGQQVKIGQKIGETGETGLTENTTLYFELRKGTTPVDPLKWLVTRP